MAQPQGTGFTNLQSIIQANKDNQLGNTVQSGIQKGISGLQSNVNQAQQQFGTDVNNANLNTTQNQQYATNTLQGIINSTPQTTSNPSPPQATTAPQQTTSSASAPAPTVTATQQAPASTSGTVSALSAPAAGTSSPAAKVQTPPNAAAASTLTDTTAPTNSQQSNANTTATAGAGSFGLSTAGSGTNQTSFAGTGITAPSAGDISQFGKLIQGSYTGPTQLNNAATLQQQGQNLQQLGSNLNTSGGRQALLQQFIGNPQYNQGEQTLDNILLGATGQKQLQNSVKASQGVGQIASNAEAQAAQQAAQQAATNQSFGQSILSQINAAENPILQNVNTNLTGLQGQQNNLNTASTNALALLNAAPTANSALAQQYNVAQGSQTLSDALNLMAQNGMINQSQLNQIQGDIPQVQQQGKNLQNLLSQAYTNNNVVNPFTMQQAANNQQAAQLTALQQLAGQDQTYNTYGGANLGTSGIDTSKLASILGLPTPVAGPAEAPGNPYTQSLLQNPAPGVVMPTSQASLGVPLSGITQGFDLAKNAATLNPSGVENSIKGITNQAGQMLSGAPQALGNTVKTIENAVTHPLGIGGGGKIICNELHRQGYINSYIIQLDEEYGRRVRKQHINAYKGYLLVARPVVKFMQKHPKICPWVMLLSGPWSRYMANQMDESIKGSLLGSIINKTGMLILPLIYKISRWL